MTTRARRPVDWEKRRRLARLLDGQGSQRRLMPGTGMEIREVNGNPQLEGWASVTEQPYDMGWYEETIKRGAFQKTLAASPDVQLLVNHQGLPLARTLSGTLRLDEDARGLHNVADLDGEDGDTRTLARKAKRGDIDQMSFAFVNARSVWDDEFEKRDIIELDIHRGDVSAVNQGANPATSFGVRALDQLSPSELTDLIEDLERGGDRRRLHSAPARLDVYRARAWTLRAKGRQTKR